MASSVEKRLDRIDPTFGNQRNQQGRSVVIPGFEIGTGVNQHLHGFGVAFQSSQQEYGVTARIQRVDPGPIRQQLGHLCALSASCSFDQTGIDICDLR